MLKGWAGANRKVGGRVRLSSEWKAKRAGVQVEVWVRADKG